MQLTLVFNYCGLQAKYRLAVVYVEGKDNYTPKEKDGQYSAIYFGFYSSSSTSVKLVSKPQFRIFIYIIAKNIVKNIPSIIITELLSRYTYLGIPVKDIFFILKGRKIAAIKIYIAISYT